MRYIDLNINIWMRSPQRFYDFEKTFLLLHKGPDSCRYFWRRGGRRHMPCTCCQCASGARHCSGRRQGPSERRCPSPCGPYSSPPRARPLPPGPARGAQCHFNIISWYFPPSHLFIHSLRSRASSAESDGTNQQLVTSVRSGHRSQTGGEER